MIPKGTGYLAISITRRDERLPDTMFSEPLPYAPMPRRPGMSPRGMYYGTQNRAVAEAMARQFDGTRRKW